MSIPAGSFTLKGPTEVTGSIEGSVSVDCQYNGSFLESTVKYWCKWSENGCSVLFATNGIVHDAFKGKLVLYEKNSSFTIIMSQLTEEAAGWYWCGIGSFEQEHVAFPVELRTVNGSPGIMGTKEITSTYGRSVTIQCHYENKNHCCTPYWCKWSQHGCATIDQKEPKIHISNFEKNGTFILTITQLQLEDAGWYWCGMRNSNYYGETFPMNLIVATEMPKSTTKASFSRSKKHDGEILLTPVVVPFITATKNNIFPTTVSKAVTALKTVFSSSTSTTTKTTTKDRYTQLKNNEQNTVALFLIPALALFLLAALLFLIKMKLQKTSFGTHSTGNSNTNLTETTSQSHIQRDHIYTATPHRNETTHETNHETDTSDTSSEHSQAMQSSSTSEMSSSTGEVTTNANESITYASLLLHHRDQALGCSSNYADVTQSQDYVNVDPNEANGSNLELRDYVNVANNYVNVQPTQKNLTRCPKRAPKSSHSVEYCEIVL
nr:PREDICTED: polymeric immunoglobulin receptor [Latimeria chalumnae]|eukprot:XP_014346520.1 PREDICTED: polymeric immunoglobulin receptor [Latimeria chalumnae]